MLAAMLLFALLCRQAAATPRHRRSDDVNLQSLQDLLAQQAVLIQSLQAKLTAQESSLHAQGDVISRLQTQLSGLTTAVAFSVRFQSDNEANGTFISDKQILKFDDVANNIGNGYDSQTGIFTAPVAGVYVFFLRLMTTESRDPVDLVIDKHGTPLDLVFAEGQADPYDQGSSEVTVHLLAGDEVWVRQQRGDAVRGRWYTSFTGFLLHAD